MGPLEEKGFNEEGELEYIIEREEPNEEDKEDSEASESDDI